MLRRIPIELAAYIAFAAAFLAFSTWARSQNPPQSDLRIWTWADWQLPGATPMVWAEYDRRSDNQRTDPVAEARRVAPMLLAHPQSDRCLFVWHAADDLLHGADKIDTLAVRLHTQAFEAWCRAFFRELAKHDARPDYIVLDYERTPGTWWLFDGVPLVDGETHPRVEIMRRVLALPVTTRHNGKLVAGLVPEDFAPRIAPDGTLGPETQTPRGRAATIAYNAWAQGLLNEALDRCVYESAFDAFGVPPNISNYADQRGAGAVDLNGWPIPSVGANRWASPVCYLWGETGGRAFQAVDAAGISRSDPRHVKLRAASQYADNVSNVRLALNETPRVAPWISHPTFAGDRNGGDADYHALLWRDQVTRLRADGVDVLLVWTGRLRGDPATERDRAIMVETFTALHATPNRRRGGMLPIEPGPVIAEQAGKLKH